MRSIYETSATAATAEEEAYDYILTSIRQGAFQPGDRLKAEDIAHRLGMSRMPVREAFRRLAAEDLLTLRPNRGTTVTRLGEDELREIFEMRSVLEGLAVRTGIGNMNARAIEDIEEILGRMERCRDHGSEWLLHHRRFHELVCSFSRRHRLIRQIGSLHRATEPYLRLWYVNVKKPIDEQKEHRGILEMLKRGDAEKAEAFMRDHIVTTAPQLSELVIR